MPIITASMSAIYKTKNYELDKLALLGLFAASLIIAWLICAARSTIKLSEPIMLDYPSLAVMMPSGNGWHAENGWDSDLYVVP